MTPNETYTYDGLGRMLTAVKEVNGVNISESAYVYNDTGKVIEANEALFGDATPAEIRYTYDQAGYPNSTTYPHPASPVVISVTPDHAGRIGTLKLGATQMVTYDYVGSRVARRSYTLANPDIEYKPDYDGLGRITSADSGTGYAKFDYQYDANSNNIGKMTYDHRTGDPCSDFSYDSLDRLTTAQYGLDDTNEAFTIDDLGNRIQVNLRDTNDVNYVVDNLTNRYDSVGGNSLAYDAAGNLITDKDDYDYTYDYENRIIKITKDGNDIAEFAYDALGRRIRKIDSIAGTTRLYFYNDKWQVLTETDVSETMKAWFAYGNYIDEVLLTAPIKVPMSTRCYVHDHLYSPAALTTASGTVQERYEYDAYGSPYVLEPNFADDPDGKTDYSNPYYFTGRRVDFLDDGNLPLQYNRNRHYDYYTGRWLTHDKIGIMPYYKASRLYQRRQYTDGMNLYQAFSSNPIVNADPDGLVTLGTKISFILGTRILTFGPLNWLVRTNEYNLNDAEGEMNAAFWRYPMTDCYAEIIRRNMGRIGGRCVTFWFSQARCPRDWRMSSSSPFSSAWWLGGAHRVSASGSFRVCCPKGGGNCRIDNRNVEWSWHDDIDAHSFIEASAIYSGSGNWLDRVLEITGLTVEGLWDLLGDKIGDSDFRVTVNWEDPGDPWAIRVRP